MGVCSGGYSIYLTDSNDPKQYINKMRKRDEELSKGWI